MKQLLNSFMNNSEKETKFNDEQFNEKRKWQIALRRYVINKSKSVAYAPYFGIDIAGFREWIETQFDTPMSWENFSKTWQFEHVLPVSFFDFSNENDLKLCWNFLNIRVEKLHTLNRAARLDLRAVNHYFNIIYTQTKSPVCEDLLKKIAGIQIQRPEPSPAQLSFLTANADNITDMQKFSAYEFERLNNGDDIKILLAEQALMQRFGH